MVASLGLAILGAGLPVAHADPSTNERRKVAEEVATSVCKNVPTIPTLPASFDPMKLCQAVLVENIDPEGDNMGVRAACALALPAPLKLTVEPCADVLDRILDPARQLFLDKVVPVAQQLACVTSTPAAFDCLAQQVAVWLKQSIIALWQALIAVLTSDTKAISVIDGWRNGGVVSLYGDIGAVAATLLLGLMITSLIISAIHFDFRRFGSTLLGVVMWGMFWSGGTAIAILLLKASDDAARWLAGRPDETGQTDLAKAGRHFGAWVDYISGATPTTLVQPLYNPGSFTGVLICLLLIVAILMALFALVMRNIALLLIIVALPLTLAGAAGPKPTREWFRSALRMFIALLLAKPLIVIAVRLGSVLVAVPQEGEPQATLSDALLGIAIILVAGLLPGVIYRFSGGLMTTSAGGAPRAHGGVIGQSAQSIQTSADMTRIIMERNAPQRALTAGSAAGTARAGSAAAAGSGLGAAAGPLGLAAVGMAMAGGALESGGRWMAGQAATGGGVFGDVEAPTVPSAPITRVPHRGSVGGQPGGGPTTGQAGAATTPATQITVLQTSSTGGPPRTPLPPSAPNLIIPGTVVPDPPVSPRSAGPKALPSGGDSRG